MQVYATRRERGHLSCYCKKNSQRREYEVEQSTTCNSVGLPLECSLIFFSCAMKEDGEEINQENKTNVSEIAGLCASCALDSFDERMVEVAR